jgi:hypothetical protein
VNGWTLGYSNMVKETGGIEWLKTDAILGNRNRVRVRNAIDEGNKMWIRLMKETIYLKILSLTENYPIWPVSIFPAVA